MNRTILITDTNINTLEVMPVCQSWTPFAIHRERAEAG